ncbi:MAG: hypothetical protein GX328_00920 [Clostridiaceae bacterium]|nr:hypothetical protein [Clostridiaceae bacterium]
MINTVLCDLPYSIKATYTINDDNSYTIFINNKLGFEEQQIAYKHELEHINRGDLFSTKDADIIENILNKSGG